MFNAFNSLCREFVVVHPPVLLFLLEVPEEVEVEALNVLHHDLGLAGLGPVVAQDLGVVPEMLKVQFYQGLESFHGKSIL